MITKLYKAVAETGAKVIAVGKETPFEVGSPEYEEKKEWFIKGGYTLESNMQPMTLICGRLDKDVTITINRPVAVNGEKLDEVSEELDSMISAVFFDKKTLEMAGKEIRIRDILPYSEACIESFKKRYPDRQIDLNDFAVVTIDWEKKNIQIRPV